MEILSDATFKGNLEVEGPLVVSDVYVNTVLDEGKIIYTKSGDAVVNTTEILFAKMVHAYDQSNAISADELFEKLKKIDKVDTIECSISSFDEIKKHVHYTGDLYFCAVPSECTRFKINTHSTMSIDMDVWKYLHSIQLYRAYPDASHTTHLKSICMDVELPMNGCEIIFNKPSGEAFDNSEIVAKVVYNNRFGISGAIGNQDWPSLPDGWFG